MELPCNQTKRTIVPVIIKEWKKGEQGEVK
jgi:hypothetical protein